MTKMILAAAAVLSLGAGAAFADGNVPAQPARITQPVAQTAQPAGSAWTYIANHSSHVDVYPAFGGNRGFVQGGNQ